MTEEKLDDSEMVIIDKIIPSSDGQFIFKHEKQPARELNVYDVKNVYRSQAEIDRAKKRGDFKIEKTMTSDKNGNIFFLCYDYKI